MTSLLLLPHLTYCILSWGLQVGKIHLLQKIAIRNVTICSYNTHTNPLCNEQNILKVHDLYRLSYLKFYFKLVNNNLPHYFKSFTPQFSLCHMHYNLRNPVRQLPMIKNEFLKQSLRYKLNATLNKILDSVLAEAQNQSQKQFIDRARQGILAQYSDTCAIHNCYVCKT